MKYPIIQTITSYLPETVLDNEELARIHKTWSADDIFKKTGIRKRRIAASTECASDLAVQAANLLFERTGMDRQEVDFILFCTQSPDYYLPATACLIQDQLGLKRQCGAIDFNQGCSGYVLGLSLAKGLIVSGQARCILLLTGETYSKHIHPQDLSVRTLFGDAGTATLIVAQDGGQDSETGLGHFVFGCNGKGGKNLIVPTGGMRRARTEETAHEVEDADGNVRSANHLYMNGPEIFRFAITEVPKTIRELLAQSGLTKEEIDYVVLHQANKFMLDQLGNRLGFPLEKIPYEFEDIGNTVSSSIPLTLERMIQKNMLQTGHKLLLVGFGVGYSWAGCDLTWR